MLRGTQKQVIHLKNPESPLFEEVIFVIKHMPQAIPTKLSMLEEATRLIEGEGTCDTPPQVEEGRQTHAPLLLFLGALGGAAFTALICLLL